MDGANWPIVLIEGLLVLGGALAFGWWQLRSVDRDRRQAQADREAAQGQRADADAAPPPAP